MLLAGTGAMLMAVSGGLIMLFLGLEIMSIALYVMAAYHRRRVQSGEAGLKYFILGSFSSAIFLYGIALVYGATGSTQFQEIASFLAGNTLAHNGVLLAGMALLDRRTGVQGGRRAVPLLDARRLPGFADTLHRATWRRWPRRPVSPVSFGSSTGLPDPAGQLAAGHLAHGRADPARRVGAGHRPEGPQADAGLLVDQPGRLCAGRRAGRLESGNRRRAVLPFHLHVHHHRHVRRGGADPGPRRGPQRPRGHPGPGPAPAAPGGGHARLPAGPGRRALHERASWPSST